MLIVFNLFIWTLIRLKVCINGGVALTQAGVAVRLQLIRVTELDLSTVFVLLEHSGEFFNDV